MNDYSSRCKEIQRFYRNTEDLPETERNWMRTYFRGADTASAPAGPGVRAALQAIFRDEIHKDDGFSLVDSDLIDAAQLALDQEPDAGELVKALQGVLDFYCPNRCGFEDHTPECAAARAALAKWKGGVK